MVSVIDSVPVSKILGNYFSRLQSTGSIDRSVTNRLLIFLFVVGYIQMVYHFLKEEDYEKIDKLLVKLFSNCNCILTYDRDVALTSYYHRTVGSTTIGKPWFMGEGMSVRVTETPEEEFRFTQDDSLRIYYDDEIQ